MKKIRLTDIKTLAQFILGVVLALAFLSLVLYPAWSKVVKWLGTW